MLRSADMLLARADVVEARNRRGPARSLMVVAENDLRRALGMIDEPFQLSGTLEKGLTFRTLRCWFRPPSNAVPIYTAWSSPCGRPKIECDSRSPIVGAIPRSVPPGK